MLRVRAALPIVLLSFGVAQVAYAGGIEYPDIGTISVGRGGAVAADPDDGMALEQNPAGLASQHGFRATLNGNYTYMNLNFAPSLGGPAASNTAGGFLAPGGVFSYGIGPLGPITGLTFALGAVGPSAIGNLQYPSNSVGRYELESSNYFIAYYSAAVAAELMHKLSIGVTFQLVQGTAEFSQAVWSGQGQQTNFQDTSNDSTATVNVKSGVIPTAVIGASFKPIPQLAIGVSFRPAFNFVGNGTLETQLPASAAALKVQQNGDSASLALNFPNVLRAGVMWRPCRWALIEADFVYEGWSVFKDITVTPNNIYITSSINSQKVYLPQIVLPENFSDTYSGRIGADFAVLPRRLWLRAGYTYETNGIPNQDVSLAFGNWGTNALSAGASLAIFGGVYIDVAYAHHFTQTQVVTNSNVKQVSTPDLNSAVLPPSTPSVIGNGTYTSTYDVFSLGIRFVLDDMRRMF